MNKTMPTCHDCRYVGKQGKDDATGQAIAWCRAKDHIVAPERGCWRHTTEKQQCP